MLNVLLYVSGHQDNIMTQVEHKQSQLREADMITLIDVLPENPTSTKLEPYFHSVITDTLDQYDIDYQNKKIAVRGCLIHEDFDHVVIDITGSWFLESCRDYMKHTPNWNYVPNDDVQYNLNYAGGGPSLRTHRIVTNMIIANLLDIKHIRYTAPVPSTAHVDKTTRLLEDYDFDHHRLLPQRQFTHTLTVKTKHGTRNMSVPSITVNGASYKPLNAKPGSEGNALAYRDTLYDNVFKHCALSIVPETSFRDRCYGPSEKTLQSIYAGQFMIWAGPWKPAEVLEKIGFDVFHDIIDHSYQYIEHPGQRIAEAFIRNQSLINDIEQQRELRIKHHARLQHNLDLVRDIDQLISNIKQLQGEHDDRSNQRT